MNAWWIFCVFVKLDTAQLSWKSCNSLAAWATSELQMLYQPVVGDKGLAVCASTLSAVYCASTCWNLQILRAFTRAQIRCSCRERIRSSVLAADANIVFSYVN